MPDVAKMTLQHVIYIPFAMMIGMIVGYIMGARAVRAELAKKKRRMRD